MRIGSSTSGEFDDTKAVVPEAFASLLKPAAQPIVHRAWGVIKQRRYPFGSTYQAR